MRARAGVESNDPGILQPNSADFSFMRRARGYSWIKSQVIFPGIVQAPMDHDSSKSLDRGLGLLTTPIQPQLVAAPGGGPRNSNPTAWIRRNGVHTSCGPSRPPCRNYESFEFQALSDTHISNTVRKQGVVQRR